MGMQTDVLATAVLTTTGAFTNQVPATLGRCRIKGAYIVCGANAGTVVITDGSGGPTLVTFNSPTVANAGAINVYIPDEGILAQTGPYGTITNTASIVLFYG